MEPIALSVKQVALALLEGFEVTCAGTNFERAANGAKHLKFDGDAASRFLFGRFEGRALKRGV